MSPCEVCVDYVPVPSGRSACGVCRRRALLEFRGIDGVMADEDLVRVAARAAVRAEDWCYFGRRAEGR